MSNPHLDVVQVLSRSILASKLIYLSVAKYCGLVDVGGWRLELGAGLAFVFIYLRGLCCYELIVLIFGGNMKSRVHS